MSKDPRTQFPLPNGFFDPESPEWIPPRAHDPAEIGRRTELKVGSLIYEEQADGAQIARVFYTELMKHGTEKDVELGCMVVAAALFGSARMSMRGGTYVTRRHFDAPFVVDIEADVRLSSKEIIAHTTEILGMVAVQNARLRDLYLRRGRVGLRTEHRAGRVMGEAAQWAGITPIRHELRSGSAYATQERVVQRGQEVLEWSRKLGLLIRANPSLAMLAGPEASNLNAHLEPSREHGAVSMFKAARKAVLSPAT